MFRFFDADIEEPFRNKLKVRFDHMLPRASVGSRDELFEAIFDPARPLVKILERLIRESCTSQEINLAMILARNEILTLYDDLPDDKRIKITRELLVHFDRLMMFLFSAVQGVYEVEWQRMQSELLQRGRAYLLSRARNEWTNEKEVYLYNYYREYPVSTVARLLRVGEQSFTIERNRELDSVVASSPSGNRILTRLPYSQLSVELVVDDATAKTAHLRYGEFFPLHKEKRREPRIQYNQPLMIKIMNRKSEMANGRLLDLSASGLGLQLHSDLGLNTGDSIVFNMQIRNQKLNGRAVIRWLEHISDRTRLGIAMEYDAEMQGWLGNEVRKQENAIMVELKLKGTPDALVTD